MALVGYGLALGQDIAYYKTEYKIQDVFVASPVSSLTYMIGLALSEILFGLPALAILITLLFYVGLSISFLPLLIFNVLIIWVSTSSMGFFLSSRMLHMKNATQIISLVNVLLAVLPPVFYSIEKLPQWVQTFAYTVPTTHASLMIQFSMDLKVPDEWNIWTGIFVEVIYATTFLFLAKIKAIWRDP